MSLGRGYDSAVVAPACLRLHNCGAAEKSLSSAIEGEAGGPPKARRDDFPWCGRSCLAIRRDC
jgi:hypothetical protein